MHTWSGVSISIVRTRRSTSPPPPPITSRSWAREYQGALPTGLFNATLEICFRRDSCKGNAALCHVGAGIRQWERLAFPARRPMRAERRGKICGHGSEEEKEPGAEDKCADPRPPTTHPSARSRARSPFSTYTPLAHHLPTINV